MRRRPGTTKRGKYKAQKTTVDNITFDSRREAERYIVLRQLLHDGKITDLRRQVKYELIPTQRDQATGRVIERACHYIADFVYVDAATGETVVEDAKGYHGGSAYNYYTIKRKLMLYRYGIRVVET